MGGNRKHNTVLGLVCAESILVHKYVCTIYNMKVAYCVQGVCVHVCHFNMHNFCVYRSSKLVTFSTSITSSSQVQAFFAHTKQLAFIKQACESNVNTNCSYTCQTASVCLRQYCILGGIMHLLLLLAFLLFITEPSQMIVRSARVSPCKCICVEYGTD
jgi:hypothetical protein